MKRLLMIAGLAATVQTVNAQDHRFHNDSPCAVEYREVCIDVSAAPSGCTITNVGSWVSVPAMTHVDLTLPHGCTSPDEVGIEVQYASSLGCPGSVIVKFDPGPYSTTLCSTYPSHDLLPPCSCDPSGTGIDVHANIDHIHITY